MQRKITTCRSKIKSQNLTYSNKVIDSNNRGHKFNAKVDIDIYFRVNISCVYTLPRACVRVLIPING